MNNSIIFKLKYFIPVIIGLLFITSCGKDLEEEVLGAKLIGSWHGETEDGIGYLDIDDFTFTSFALNQVSGTWMFDYKALDTCDEDIYFCLDNEEPCGGEFIFIGMTGATYNFNETLISGDCYDGGTAEITFIDDNTIAYTYRITEDGEEVVRKSSLNKVR